MPQVYVQVWLIHVPVRDNLLVDLIINSVDAVGELVFSPPREINTDRVLFDVAQTVPPHVERSLRALTAVVMIDLADVDF